MAWHNTPRTLTAPMYAHAQPASVFQGRSTQSFDSSSKGAWLAPLQSIRIIFDAAYSAASTHGMAQYLPDFDSP
eukprot:1157767-Pelagomonas_calceolata.AAC.10